VAEADPVPVAEPSTILAATPPAEADPVPVADPSLA
jgi:hypothetical protein